MGTHLAFGERSHTAAHTPKQGAFLPWPQRGLELPVKFLLVRHAFIYIHFPVLCDPPLSATAPSQTISHHDFQLLAQMAHACFCGQKRDTLGFAQMIAHGGSQGETGAFRTGPLSLPSDCFTRCGNPAWPGGRTANFAAFGSWSETLLKNAESLRSSDALMRVAVPKASRPRWAA